VLYIFLRAQNPSRRSALRLDAVLGALLLLPVMVGSAQTPTPPGNWKTFTSSTGFSVAYPGRWFPIGASEDRLQILSSNGGAEGVIIKRGQALISVLQVGSAQSGGMAAAIARETRGATVFSRRRVSVQPVLGAPQLIWEVISRSPAVPPQDILRKIPDEISTDYFVQSGTHIVDVTLVNWEGDGCQASYQDIAAKMGASIRYPLSEVFASRPGTWARKRFDWGGASGILASSRQGTAPTWPTVVRQGKLSEPVRGPSRRGPSMHRG